MPVFLKPKPDHEAYDLLTAALERWHGQLAEHKVTIGLLFTDTLKLHGYACAMTVKVTPYKQRVLGVEDVVITIDDPWWQKAIGPEREAAFDHELQHLELLFDKKTGEIKTDDLNRPKLKCKLHDWQLGGFAIIADRHKDNALEVQGFKATLKEYQQQLFRWGDDMAPADSVQDLPGQGKLFEPPEAGETSVTFSSGDKSVTLTGEQLRKIAGGTD